MSPTASANGRDLAANSKRPGNAPLPSPSNTAIRLPSTSTTSCLVSPSKSAILADNGKGLAPRVFLPVLIGVDVYAPVPSPSRTLSALLEEKNPAAKELTTRSDLPSPLSSPAAIEVGRKAIATGA